MAYHVLLEGRRMGPYDRRTIVGLRIKKTLRSEHQLEASDGSLLTVAELLGRRPADTDFNPLRSGGYSAARATFSAGLIGSGRGALKIPAFRGEVEVRVHSDVLRIAGQHRSGLRLKEGRLKLPIRDVAHARVTGSMLELWLRSGDRNAPPQALQCITLDLFSDETTRELLRWLPDAKPWHEPAAEPAAVRPAIAAPANPMVWAAVLGVFLAVGLVLLIVLSRRF